MDGRTEELMKVKGIVHTDVGEALVRSEWEADNLHDLSNGDSFPGGPTEMDFFYRNDEHKWYYYNGTDWITMVA